MNNEDIYDLYGEEPKLSVGGESARKGYIDYAEGVIVDRALPDLRDGLKPSQRRIMYTAYSNKSLGLMKDRSKVKSADLCGSTMKFHPHGDATIYTTLVPMVSRNGTMATAPFDGQGNFGRFDSPNPPAASRYTEVCISDMFHEYFKGVDGVKFVPTDDAKTVEPEVLPVSFPAILCNHIKGVAVGFSTSIPSFNFNDVIDLTIEYLRNGKCSTVICPDFVDGGYYIKNMKELNRLMTFGTAKLKLKGKMTIADREIKMTQFPCDVSLKRVETQINKLNLPIKNGTANDLSGRTKGTLLDVIVTSRNRVDEVVNAILRDTSFQVTLSASMVVMNNGKPELLGVWDIVANWVNWRKQVVINELKAGIPALKERMKHCSAFMKVIAQEDKKEEILLTVARQGSKVAEKYILDNFKDEEFDEETAKWLCSSDLSNFHKGGKYKEQYEKSLAEYNAILYNIEHIEEKLINDLTALKEKFGHKYPRKTEISTVDYAYITEENVDESMCYYTIRNNFILKSNIYIPYEDGDIVLEGKANETFILIDNRGRVCRIYCEDIPYTTTTGIYLPKYFELEENESYKIMWVDKLQPVEKTILYKDGNIGFIDLEQWCDVKRKVKVIPNGTAPAYANIIGCVIDSPDVLLCCTNTGKFAYLTLTNFKRKSRTAKSRAFNLAKNEEIASYGCISINDLVTGIGNLSEYGTKPIHLIDVNDIKVPVEWFSMMK